MTDPLPAAAAPPEGAARRATTGPWPAISAVAGLAATALVVYYIFNLGLYVGYVPLETIYFFALIALLMPFVFIYNPVWSGVHAERVPWYDIVLALLTAGLALWLAWTSEDALMSAWTYAAPPGAQWAALAFCLLAVEATRRSGGLILTAIVVFFATYPVWADHAPSPLDAPASTWLDTAAFQVYSAEGVVGLPFKSFAALVVGYLIFGVALQATGAGRFFLDIAFALTGSVRGGPAKVAILSSGLMGSVSGSVVSNVITTGTMTIPAMKRVGIKASYAGGVEACASTGGVLMPPVMGATAFLMATLINRPYSEIVIAAAVPSLLYYFGLFMQIDAYAAKNGLKGLPRAELPSVWQALTTGWYHLFAFVLLLVLLLHFQLEVMAPFYATILLVAVHLVRLAVIERQTWPLSAWGGFFAEIMRLFTELAGLLVGIGLIIGGLSLSGKMGALAHAMISLAGGNALLLLVMGAFTSFILGMGMTVTAAYLFLAISLAPALEQLGFNVMAVHLFMLYWSMLSFITPPVAIGAFAAASIARAPPMETGWQAMRLGTIIYFIPFFFVLNPALILEGTLWQEVSVISAAVAGIVFIAAGLQGWLVMVGPTGEGMGGWVLRCLLVLGGLCLTAPGGKLLGVTNLDLAIAAAVILVPTVAAMLVLRRRSPAVAAPEISLAFEGEAVPRGSPAAPGG